MKKLFYIILFLFFNFHSYSQLVSDQLIRLHNVPSVVDLNNIISPLAGQLAFVITENSTYQYNGTEWVALGVSTSSSTSDTSSIIIDEDRDTWIKVDDGADNDLIEYALAGTTYFRMNKARFEVLNSQFGVFVGQNAGASNTSSYNVGVGYNALTSNTVGSLNTACGYNTLSDVVSGYRNSAFGAGSLSSNASGVDNSAVGYNSLGLGTLGGSNSAFGSSALLFNRGSYNSAFGRSSSIENMFGDNNCSFGYLSLKENISGDRNCAFGSSALVQTKGSNNIGIGYDAQVANPLGSNQVRMGNSAIVSAAIQVSWSTSSDLHWKEKVRDLPYGMKLISKLRPVDYVRKNSTVKTREVGFIAQELVKVLEEVGFDDQGFLTQTDQGHYEVRYNDFIPIAIKGIQEQQEEIEQLKTKYNQLLERVEQLEKY
ncbi:MAG: tail fiber domain-containing protein [Flavobacteriales bacterium]|nr:tail fiber domain-containing protein [Flavobacteriales bacterium]